MVIDECLNSTVGGLNKEFFKIDLVDIEEVVDCESPSQIRKPSKLSIKEVEGKLPRS